MTGPSLKKAIVSCIRKKYGVEEVDHQLEYLDAIMPANLPRGSSCYAGWGSKRYAEHLCQNYFGW